MVTTDIIETMVTRIVRQFAPVRVVLFGSQARGDAGPWSDVDLLVVLDDCPNHHRATVAICRALSDLPVCKDIIVTTPGEIDRFGDQIGFVLRPALAEGKVLYERG